MFSIQCAVRPAHAPARLGPTTLTHIQRGISGLLWCAHAVGTESSRQTTFLVQTARPHAVLCCGPPSGVKNQPIGAGGVRDGVCICNGTLPAPWPRLGPEALYHVLVITIHHHGDISSGFSRQHNYFLGPPLHACWGHILHMQYLLCVVNMPYWWQYIDMPYWIYDFHMPC